MIQVLRTSCPMPSSDPKRTRAVNPLYNIAGIFEKFCSGAHWGHISNSLAGGPEDRVLSSNGRIEMTLKSGSARVIVEWGYDLHEIILTPRNWSRIKRGGKLKIRSIG